MPGPSWRLLCERRRDVKAENAGLGGGFGPGARKFQGEDRRGTVLGVPGGQETKLPGGGLEGSMCARELGARREWFVLPTWEALHRDELGESRRITPISSAC